MELVKTGRVDLLLGTVGGVVFDGTTGTTGSVCCGIRVPDGKTAPDERMAV